MKKILAASFGFALVAMLTMGAGTVVNTPGIPAGAIMAFGGGSCPQGWLAADGVAKSSTTYPALDTYFGTTWGARSGGNFQIPDLNGSGRYLRGGVAGTLQAQATAKNSLALTGTTTFSSSGHTHDSGTMYAQMGIATNFVGLIRSSSTFTSTTHLGFTSSGTSASVINGAVVTGTSGASAATGTVSLGNGDSETRPITATVLYCIKY